MTKKLAVNTNELAMPSELASFYNQNAGVGSENLSMSLPQLKITEANSKNEEADGQHAQAGTFYYSPTKESFEDVRVSIMTISRGFYALDNSDTPRPKFTQLMGGMLLDTMQPFIMFVSGTRLQKMWDFGKEVKPFTKSKTNKVPMFAFDVTLSLEEIESNYGKNHIVNYELARTKNGQIQLIGDMNVVEQIRSSVEGLESMFEDFIGSKEVDKSTGESLNNKPVYADITPSAGVTKKDAERVFMNDVDESSNEDISEDVPF